MNDHNDTDGSRPASPLAGAWQEVRGGHADEQKRIDTLVATGRGLDKSWADEVFVLIDDKSEIVRSLALQTLVLDLGEKSARSAGKCWSALLGDDDDDVRAMAASCLGSIFFNVADPSIFRRLLALLHSEKSGYVKGSIYRALFSLAGRPPDEWPGITGPTTVSDSTVDWELMRRFSEAIVERGERLKRGD